MKKIKWETILTIIISLLSAFVAWKAYEVCVLQTEITRNSVLPNIQVKEYQEINEETFEVYDSAIEISNLEGRIDNYESEIVTYLRCEYVDDEYNYFRVKVPIAFYYIVGNSSNEKKGIIEKKRSLNNYEKLKELEKKVFQYDIEHDKESINIKIESCIKISYLDLLGEGRENFYWTNIFSTRMIDKRVGEQIIRNQNKLLLLGHYVDFNSTENCSVEQLIDTIRKIAGTDLEREDASAVENEAVVLEFKNAIDMALYVFAVSLQLAGALLLLVFVISTKRQEIIKRFAGKGIITRDSNTKEISYDEEEFKATFRIGYINKCAFSYIAIGYLGGVFGDCGENNRIMVGLLILLCTVLLMAVACLCIDEIVKKSKKINRKITNEELVEVGIEPDMESISNEEIKNLFNDVQ